MVVFVFVMSEDSILYIPSVDLEDYLEIFL